MAMLCENLHREMFRAYDIRGIVDTQLTPEVSFAIGRGIATMLSRLKKKQVIVGRDGRLSSSELTQNLCRGLQQSGIDVLDIGQVPSPVLYYATHRLAVNSGVMVTGSHNPGDYNGFKILLDGNSLSNTDIEQLYKLILHQDFVSGKGGYSSCRLNKRYIAEITQSVQLHRPVSVVVDAGNGVTGAIAPELFSALGCEVFPLYCDIDGAFPNHHPDPGQPQNLVALVDKVKAVGADIGFAFDGDGDRIGVVTAEGKIIWPDRLLMLLSREIIKRNPGAKIVFDIKCSRHLATTITELGGEAIQWKTGHSLIKQKMQSTGALLAGEMSGHIFFKDGWYGFDDALYTAARLLKILTSEKQQSDALFATVPESISTPELKLPVLESEKFLLMDKLKEILHFEDAHCNYLDGVRIDFSKGWGLIRPSNTTPVLVLRFEADSTEEMEKIQEKFRVKIKKILPRQPLPF